MKIYTSYFGQLKNIQKDNIIPIAICRYLPKYYNGLVYQKIAPSEDILNTCRGSHNEYIKRFNNEILSILNPIDVVRDIAKLSNKQDVCLLCYETPEKFCHRHLVAKWLNDYFIDINIKEYNPNNNIKQTDPLF